MYNSINFVHMHLDNNIKSKYPKMLKEKNMKIIDYNKWVQGTGFIYAPSHCKLSKEPTIILIMWLAFDINESYEI